MAETLLSIENLSVRIDTSRGPIHPVRNLDLSIARGEMVGLVGESGSGKSVTAMSITGLLPARQAHITGGHIRFDGRDLAALSDRQMRRIRGKDIATIFQEPMTALNPVFTIRDQLTEPLRQHMRLGRRQAADRAGHLLDMVGIRNTARVLAGYPHELSGGMRQRVMIAMAMACEPKLLIADEPTTALDVTTQLQILDLIMDLQEQHGTAVLLITHDLGVVAQTCQRVAVMYGGELQETASTEQLFAAPQADYTKRLLSFIPSANEHVVEAVEALAEGGTARDGSPGRVETRTEAPDDDAPVLLEVTDLTKVFTGRRRRLGRPADTVRAVDGVSFRVRRGRTLAIVGESGSGKSTTGRALLRLHEPTSGAVTFNGADLLAASDDELRRLRSEMQIVFQDTYASLDPRWTIHRALAEPLRLHTDLDDAAIRARIVEVMETVGLREEDIDRFPHEFSGGQRQRIGIARALILNPSLVVCDEPVSALDVSVQAQVLDLMKQLQRDLGLTYVFISHDLSVVEMMADEIVVMSQGRVVEQGSVEQIFRTPRHPYTRALLAAIPVADPTARVDRAVRRRIVERGVAAADLSEKEVA
ncbi:ABC transporter ATP-binding protein [Micromonospora sagamiensis]|uniref:Peptide/nickel transport system ATP-binding protein/glutathione transport system ATP-binding protein n=1 Tax=Micromonospora sagamiensis TaxID=47875 RepID=A0A562WEQ4_9ACTN|nr:ABC transporter ATP-binding protein [Micromonospora sagamiensis]TWJ28759.1 peptide/nickel transport system ATP-binding protein/glutathione transport system ATP-binding protein [Micromonospora sagamiensis]BCL12335.1 ABC transporter permease [Micromonospora sagamiensis]